MTLGPQPYYWPNYDGSEPSYGNSMPIATRSGWMATGCLPFVILMAGKSNLVTMVTGVSHERLQPFHRWISYAMFILALIHTFPFIVYHIRIGDMVEKWNTQLFYWTGVVALIAQAYLTFASMGPLRNMGYEWFKFSHFLAALIFTLFFFFHCDFTLTSAQYFVVTVVFFAASWLHRQLRIYVEHGIGHRATISVAANGFVRVSVPTKARWRAGQHFFVRFMGLHVWATHPFSACSLPARASFNISVESKLVFYIRPQKGFTARLARYAETHLESQTRVLLDGPYGGVDMQKIVSCQRSVVIAGGSGAGWVLPLVIAFLRNLQLQSIENPQRPSLRVILVTRDKATQTWFEKAVADEIAACPVDSLTAADYSIELYYTGTTEDEQYPRLTGQLQKNFDDPEKAPVIEGVPKSELESSSRSSRSDVLAKPINVRRHDGRPDLSAIIAQEGDAQRVDSALGVFVCGPASMQSGATNAVAREQLRIMKDGSREMYFHCEHFSWA
ncbi:Ferric/cupric reductase transmembrane component 7 [Fulvia fulva]|uniref:ferric-chelate reductase (NADPH) n=1 Tax=Passalora fulva TaxID=5499 RepID=A0A9Q8L5L5_PASFU|nr:Ferric/cupric reductase transmembrane component 7 [Fulvia fulva]KAK4634831.1 Ferric/cupric reductase transmembrane component 7 [Fulvia fulva]KAK4637426.1 Ferric/cupric reductase transmembrane component 7 [Fulvia fulva]UJO11287.1 Ferric/cupric reductase transmembrane component 7 [Fulvia fulva]WPV08564.1 Ferric/cupric reductase transmembrane component 7 [Fulvia fulva]WPV24575.1 Ferric/cupric reductase transmembrane component 7 [Fulvia fulva]